MKRMIADSLITWVKSLFHRIAPGTGEGDIEIGGNLEVDGNVTGNNLIGEGVSSPLYASSPIITFSGYGASISTLTGSTLTYSTVTSNGNLYILNGGKLWINHTSLTEEQLQKLIALIPAE